MASAAAAAVPASAAAPSAAAAAAAPALAAAHPAPLPLLLAFLAVQEERAKLYSSFHAAFRRFLASGEEGTYVRTVQALTGAFADCSQQVRALEAKLAAPAGAGGAGRPDLATLLRAVQNGEADKLKLTVSWQALRKAATPLQLATAGGGPAADSSSLEQPLQQLAIEAAAGAATATCGHNHHHRHAHAHTDGCSNGTAAAAKDAPAGGAGQRRACDQLNAGHLSKSAATAAHTHGACGAAAGALAPHVAAAAAGGYGPDGVVAPLAAEVEAAARDAAKGLDEAIAVINEALEEIRYAVAELREAEEDM